MTIDARRLAPAFLALVALGGCETIHVPEASKFGDANRMTMAAQVVDPDPQYDTLNPPTSGESSGKAAERHRTGTVKKPARTSSTQASGSGGGSN